MCTRCLGAEGPADAFFTKVEVQRYVGGEYVGGEARVIDGHKCSRMMIQILSFKVDRHSNR